MKSVLWSSPYASEKNRGQLISMEKKEHGREGEERTELKNKKAIKKHIDREKDR